MVTQKKILSPSEVAKMLMISPITLRQWAQKGKIQSHSTLGGHRRFFYSDVFKFAERENITLLQGNGEQQLRVNKILIVEDDKSFAQLFETVLSNHNNAWEIHLAYDGFEAGIKTQQLQPDVIFVDLKLPGILGDELCRNIKSNPALSAIRIIGMTGHTKKENTDAFLKAGAEIVIEKPLNFDLLYKILDG